MKDHYAMSNATHGLEHSQTSQQKANTAAAEGTVSRIDRAESNSEVGHLERNRVEPEQTQFMGLPPTLESKAAGAEPFSKPTQSTEPADLVDSNEPSPDRLIKSKSDRRSTRNSDGGFFGHFNIGNNKFQTQGKISKVTGRLDLVLKETGNGDAAKTIGAALQNHLRPARRKEQEQKGEEQAFGESHPQVRPNMIKRVTTAAGISDVSKMSIPKMNIVIMVIGSRGDIQPFLKIGKLLKEDHGHRVRIATHPAFREFVEKDIGLEFFSVGGDPAELMAFMVKNPGLIPSLATIKTGEIGRRRDSMFEMFQGFWQACMTPSHESVTGADGKSRTTKNPFVADAIIANPPSLAHIHCAERLGVPIHIMFTFPYTPTQQFPHPLANIHSTNIDANYTNLMSYSLVEMLTFQGLGDLVNRFRVQTLGLEPISSIWSPGQLYRLKVPHTYMWSPALIPKPADWGPEVDLAGFVFLDLATNFKPPEDLVKFLDAGEPPVYIGFGSIVVDDPNKFTALIFKAVAQAGVRALVSKGWGGLGDKDNTPENIYMLENTPHDWLFPRVRAVVHHGGAGTTAIGLKCGKPTMVVPFFGDQPFWGAMIAKAGAGAEAPIPYKKLNVDALVKGIKQCLAPEAQKNAEKLAESIELEGDGANNAIDSFHRHLPLSGEHSIRCSILHDRVAVWALKNSVIRLSALAAEFLIGKRKITWKDLRLVRNCDWSAYDGPAEPITGAGQAMISSAANAARGVGSLPRRLSKTIKKRNDRTQLMKVRENAVMLEAGLQNEKSAMTMNGSNTGAKLDHTEPSGAQDSEEGHPLQKQDSAHLRIPLDAMNGQAPEGMAKHLGSESWITSSVSSSEDIATDLAVHTGHALGETGEALFKAPIDISHAISQGFHNAPRLYGDKIRPTPRITGMHSGLRAAGHEFRFGIYDGVTGLVLQPYRGAKDHGALGLVEGLGKGLGGFIIKDLSAFISPWGYAMKGIEQEFSKATQPTAYLRRAQMSSGARDLSRMDFKERIVNAGRIESAWKVIVEVRKELDAMKAKGLQGRMEMRREKKRLQREGKLENVDSIERALRERRAKAWLAKQRTGGEPEVPCDNCVPEDQAWGAENEERDTQNASDTETQDGKPRKRKSIPNVRLGRKWVFAREKAQAEAEDAHARWAIHQRAKAIETMGGESAARAIVDAIIEEEDSKAALKEELHRDEREKRRKGQDTSGINGALDAIESEERGRIMLEVLAEKEGTGVPVVSREGIEDIKKAVDARLHEKRQAEAKNPDADTEANRGLQAQNQEVSITQSPSASPAPSSPDTDVESPSHYETPLSSPREGDYTS